MKIYNLAIILLFFLFSSWSCDNKSTTSRKTTRKKPAVEKVTRLVSPVRNTQLTIGETVNVKIATPDSIQLDSMQFFLRGQLVATYTGTDSVSLPTMGVNPGKAGVRAKVFFNDSLSENHSVQLELLSDIIPEIYRYRVVNTYPHDVGAYTQGLIYYDGWLYEGTGNYNQSTIRKVRLETGEVIQARNNASDIFGEGITIFNGRIYQLTYRSQICFVYDLNTFEEIKKYNFQNREGWGLTDNGEELIMSDGTHVIYFLDPEMFTVKRQIEVYNNEGKVEDLNELEYINGKIYANRYYTDEIVIIDPTSGKEEARVDMKGILDVKDRKPSTNVLNGIAWDGDEERLFVTGKYWPKLFEIELAKVP